MISSRKKDKHGASRIGQMLIAAYEWISAMICALVVLVVLFTFVVRTVGVDGTSMVPTLQHGDRVLLSRLADNYDRGDIVVVSRRDEEPLIKRVVATEGDVVEITADGEFLLNGSSVFEPYIQGTTVPRDMTGKVKVPKGHLFLMGDNRSLSKDSRMNEVGMVPVENVLGKALIRMWPIQSIGSVYYNLEERYAFE
ncbi:MAG: signal peptidase I [Clostridia bacterium]|nr:signal peptidase I [Clostridia bacterium]